MHIIRDVNKTERKIKLHTWDDSVIEVGKSSNRLLIGAFFRNQDRAFQKIDPNSNIIKQVRNEIKAYLSEVLDDPKLKELELYQEVEMY